MNWQTLGRDSFEIEQSIDEYLTVGRHDATQRLAMIIARANRHLENPKPGTSMPDGMKEILANLETMERNEFSRWWREQNS